MTSLAIIPNLAGPPGWIILFLVILLFGAKRIPDLAKGLGQAMREFSKGKDDDLNKDLPGPKA